MNEAVAKFIQILSSSKRVLVTTHVRPDGDAIGTVAAIVLALRQKQIDSTVVLLSKLPSKYAFVLEEPRIPHHNFAAGWDPAVNLDDFDALLVADTGTWSQLPGLQQRIEPWPRPKLVLDHHLTQESWADAKLVDTRAAAAGEVAVQLLDAWGVTMTPEIATALYVALVSDTGWFQFSNTRPPTLRLAARLMDAGVDTDRLNQLLNQSERAERIALQTRAMQSLQLLVNNRLAVMTIARQDFLDTNANVPDTENLINIPLAIKTVEVSVLLVEQKEPGPIRVSLRSKGHVDCARFAEQFGGGGHARAAGCKFEGTLAAAQAAIVPRLIESMRG